MEPFGLTSEEVQTSRELHGDNRLSELKRESFGDKLKNNFRDPMIRILCVALGINIVFVILGHTEWYEAVGIAGRHHPCGVRFHIFRIQQRKRVPEAAGGGGAPSSARRTGTGK